MAKESFDYSLISRDFALNGRGLLDVFPLRVSDQDVFNSSPGFSEAAGAVSTVRIERPASIYMIPPSSLVLSSGMGAD